MRNERKRIETERGGISIVHFFMKFCTPSECIRIRYVMLQGVSLPTLCMIGSDDWIFPTLCMYD